jgi:imidazolonepropionase-like amidohydrolase
MSETLIENVYVISMMDDASSGISAVLISDGRISAVGSEAVGTASADIDRIDGMGGYLIPGLTDMHNHLDSPESLKLQLAYGITSIRNMWGTTEVLELRRAELAGELLAPDIMTTTPLIDGDPPYFLGGVSVTSPDEVEELVLGMKQEGYTALKTYELLPLDVYEALAHSAELNEMTIEGHIPQAVDPFRAIELGHDSLEHGFRIDAAIVADDIPYSTDFRSKELVALVARVREGEFTFEDVFLESRLRTLGREMVSNGTALVPTLGVWGTLSFSESDRRAIVHHPLFKYVNPLYRPMWSKVAEKEKLLSDGVKAPLTDEEIASLDLFHHSEPGRWTRILHEEGVLILAGVDAPNPGQFQGYSLHEELEFMVLRAGMSNYEALQTATVNPAAFWGIQGQRGVIAPGAEADLVLLHDNPLDDISNTRGILGVMTDGRWLSRARLDELLEEVADAYSSDPTDDADLKLGFPVHLHVHPGSN